MKATKDIKRGRNGTTFDFSGMKEPDTFTKNGYQLQAVSTNGINYVTSFIAMHEGRRIYGYYDYQKAQYVEESIC